MNPTAVPAFSLPLNTVVQASCDSDLNPRCGYIAAREWYDHHGGIGEYVYVRWLARDGVLSNDLTRLHVSEVKEPK